MNWEAISAIGQIFGALALFLVFVQVRHTRVEMRRTLTDSLSHALISVAPISTDARVLSATTKAHASLGGAPSPFVAALMEQAGLNEEEARLISHEQVALWNAFVQQVRFQGALRPVDRMGLDINLRRVYGTLPISRLFYETQAKASMNPEVAKYMNEVLSRPA